MSLEGLFQQRLEDPSSDALADRPAAGREHGGAPLPARVGRVSIVAAMIELAAITEVAVPQLQRLYALTRFRAKTPFSDARGLHQR